MIPDGIGNQELSKSPSSALLICDLLGEEAKVGRSQADSVSCRFSERLSQRLRWRIQRHLTYTSGLCLGTSGRHPLKVIAVSE